MKKLFGLLSVTLVMVAFQNCGRVAFESVESGLSKTGFVQGPEISEVLINNDEVVTNDDADVVVEAPELVIVDQDKKDEVVIVAQDEVKKDDVVADDQLKDVKKDDFAAKDEDKKGEAVITENDSSDDQDKEKKDEEKKTDTLTDEEVDLIACGNSDKHAEKKVLICHYPPGNPAARHTLCISRSALHAHDHHGKNVSAVDTLGACDGLDVASSEDAD